MRLSACVLLILPILLLYALYHTHVEGFALFPDSQLQAGQDRFNSFMSLINLANPQIPFNADNQRAVAQATAGVGVAGSRIPGQMSGTLNVAQTVCESVKSADCGAFANPQFAANCGISFDPKGTDSTGAGHLGGLYISPDDRIAAVRTAPDNPQFQPSIGTAARGSFAVDASSCTVIQEQLACQQSHNLSSPNCAQCFTTNAFHRLDPATPRISPSFMIQTNATALAFIDGAGGQHVLQVATDMPTAVDSFGIREGDVYYFTASGDPASLYLSGYLTAPTAKGTFNLDLNALIDTDMVTNYKPRLGGSQMVGQMRCFVLRPGTGQGTMRLRGHLPFSFIGTAEYDTINCDNGPFITQAASANFLASDPCYAPGSAPGSYNLDCLQQLFVSMGGTTAGTAYPRDTTTASALLKAADGTPRSLGDIANYLYDLNVRASTGKDSSGASLSISDWNAATMATTGTQITSPCDEVQAGQVPSDTCIQYLYAGGGAPGKKVGPTYSLGSGYASRDSTGNPVYCTAAGRLSPTTDAGLARARAAGSVAAIQALYDSAHKAANDNTQANSMRWGALMDCYGVDVQRKEPEVFGVGGYIYKESDAPAVCAKYDARVATKQEVADAHANGASWCMAGWVSDSPGNFYYPMQQAKVACGGADGVTTGVSAQSTGWLPHGSDDPASIMAAVNCYGPKPDQSMVMAPDQIAPFQTMYQDGNQNYTVTSTTWYQPGGG